jgi:ribose 5-phosphate isomerase B
MRIVIGSDHGGYQLKEEIKLFFDENHIDYLDVGTYSNESVDYPDYALKIGNSLLKDHFDFGIAICGTGIGISIAMNKIKGIRAALVYDENTARLAKEHNQANVLAFGGRTHNIEQVKKMIKVYMDSNFEERHINRINKISNIEKE